MMNLEVNYTLEQALNLGWQTLAECFQPNEVGIKQVYVEKYWPKRRIGTGVNSNGRNQVNKK